MKLVIQIPCYNEAETLPRVVAALPRELPGIDIIEVLVIDDGSDDGTSDVARSLGVQHLVRFPVHRGLAAAFAAGLDAALQLGADVVVNTDGDNQYDARFIPALIEPILEGRAEMVIGERTGPGVAEFSPLKRGLQRLGSWSVRSLSGTSVPDAASGFRALSREAALRLNVFSDFTSTHESIIQAGKKNLAIASVPVGTNPATRPSRLFRSLPEYLARSIPGVIRIYVLYRPFRVLAGIGAVLIAAGSIGIIRFLIYYFAGNGTGKIQSLLLSAALVGMGFQGLLIALVADLIGANRRLLEEILFRLRRLEGSPRSTQGTRPATETERPDGSGKVSSAP